MRSVDRPIVGFLIVALLFATYCDAQEEKPSARIPLPPALFSPLARAENVRSHTGPDVLEGPVMVDGGDFDDVRIRCATRGGSGSGTVKPGGYLAFVQPFYDPFKPNTLFRGYASDAGFLHMIGPPLDHQAEGVRCCRVGLTDVGIDQVTLTVPEAARALFSEGQWVRIVLAPTAGESAHDAFPAVSNVVLDYEFDVQAVAESRLERIGNAILKYLGKVGHFPPHVVRGRITYLGIAGVSSYCHISGRRSMRCFGDTTCLSRGTVGRTLRCCRKCQAYFAFREIRMERAQPRISRPSLGTVPYSPAAIASLRTILG
jgi:hypothetical protein